MAKSKKKIPNSNKLSEGEKLDIQIMKKSEMSQIFDLTEKRNKKRDKKKEDVIIQLVGGNYINLDILASDWQSHKSQYTVDFYIPLFKLLNLPGDPSSFTDRFDKKIADFKNAVIWGRFQKEPFKELRRKNKYSSYFIRKHWHYQGLNDKGLEMLQTFISQATDVMHRSTTYYEFRQKMLAEHGLGYQARLF